MASTKTFSVPDISLDAKTGILTITIDTKVDGEASGSGKSKVLSSTRGNVTLSDGLKLGLNLYRPTA